MRWGAKSEDTSGVDPLCLEKAYSDRQHQLQIPFHLVPQYAGSLFVLRTQKYPRFTNEGQL